MQFYTYVWYDPDWIPYYVGKGVGCRSRARRGIPHPEEGHVVLKYFDYEEEAYEHEKALIAFWGRRDLDTNGLLLNKCSGGPGQPGVPKTQKQMDAALRNSIKMRRLSPRAPKEFFVTPPEGREYKIFNLLEFCKNNSLHDSCMVRVAQGERKHHKGWKCRYA